jgi:hypothetical protein
MPQLEPRNRIGLFAGEPGGLPALSTPVAPTAAQTEAFQRILGSVQPSASKLPARSPRQQANGTPELARSFGPSRQSSADGARRSRPLDREPGRTAETRSELRRPAGERKVADPAVRPEARRPKDELAARETTGASWSPEERQLTSTPAARESGPREALEANQTRDVADGSREPQETTESTAIASPGDASQAEDVGEGHTLRDGADEATAESPSNPGEDDDATASLAGDTPQASALPVMNDPSWLVLVQNPVGPVLAPTVHDEVRTDEVGATLRSSLPTAPVAMMPGASAPGASGLGDQAGTGMAVTGTAKSDSPAREAMPSLEAALFQELRVQSLEVVRRPVATSGGPEATAMIPGGPSTEGATTGLPGAMTPVAVASQGDRPDTGSNDSGARDGEAAPRELPVMTPTVGPEVATAEEVASQAASSRAADPENPASDPVAAIGVRDVARPEGVMSPAATMRDAREVLARPTQGPESQQPARPVQDVVRSYLANTSRDQVSSELRLQLSPEHLGRIEVRVRAQEGVVTAIIRVDQPHAHQALEQQFGDLKQTLLDQGVRLDKVEVQLANDPRHREQQADLGGGAWQQGRQQSGQDSRSFRRRGFGGGWEEEDPMALQFAEGVPMMRHGSGQAGGFDTRA